MAHKMEKIIVTTGKEMTERDRSWWNNTCNVCEKSLVCEGKFIRFEFSFCDEYGCDMNLCKDCLEELYNKLITEKGETKND